jgi:acyl-CoA synthetase (AMP-forming)/AMP-acid ligase II
MKKREMVVAGNLNKSGGLNIYMGDLSEFFKQHPGCRVIARFTVLGKSASEAVKGYYFNGVVPQMKQALWISGERKTEEQTEIFLRQLSPVTIVQTPNEITGKYESTLRDISELSNPELCEHIEFIKQLAAEEYGTFIDDPK